MKLTIAALLLSPVFASKAAKLAKFSKEKAAKSAGYGRSMSMSASMSVGPEPPITLKGCGESFTNEKVVLSDNLNCGARIGDCAVKLDGPEAELNCKDYTLSQIANPPFYDIGPFSRGICLSNGAKARNCNVQQFVSGIDVRNGGAEVVNSNLGSNFYGIRALFNEDSTLTIEDTDVSSNGGNGLYITVNGDGINAELNVNGQVTANSNEGNGIVTELVATNSNVEINVESGATLKSCGNTVADINGNAVPEGSKVDFSGTGYTCDQDKVVSYGPTCQACA